MVLPSLVKAEAITNLASNEELEAGVWEGCFDDNVFNFLSDFEET